MPAESVRTALDRYAVALEQQVALRYAREHGLRPGASGTTLDPSQEAQRLLQAVRALPELAEESSTASVQEERSTGAAVPPAPREFFSAPAPQADRSPYPLLGQRLARAPLVIVGGVARPGRLTGLDASLLALVEWVDTTRKGTHAIGNLERRIRDRRISALILIEGALSHKHSDPLVSAARQVALPCAYAGKGGAAALGRALQELESMLAQHEAAAP